MRGPACTFPSTAGSRPDAGRGGPATAALVALFLVAASSMVEAQGVTTAAMGGRVVDADGRPLADVLVEIRHPATGATASAVTGEDGRYHLESLRPGGPYELRATRIGYAPATREELVLALGQRLRVDLVLTEEALPLPELRVRVETDPAFNPSRLGAATFVDQATVERLPTISRNFVDFATLSPLAKSGDEGRGISVGGQNFRFNNIQVDGALNQDVFGLSPGGVAGGRANARPIPLEAIDQFQVLIAPYDVRQSGFTGGVLNAVTRSGTNRWEGAVFGFWRDEVLLGDLEVDGDPLRIDQLDNLYLGGTVSGPIARDRAHFFVAGEVERRRQPPTGFNLGSADPLRVGVSPDSAQRMMDLLMALGAAPGTYRAVTLENELANLFARVDVQLSADHRLLLRHNFAGARDDPAPNRLPGDAYELSSSGTEVESSNHSTVAQLVSRLGEHTSNELFVNLQFLRDEERPLADFPRVEVEVASEVDGRLLTRELRAGAALFAHANDLDQNILQVADNFTWTPGRHRLLVGASLERFGIDRLFLPGSLGSYRFESLAALAANRPSRYDIELPLDPSEDPGVSFSVVQLAGYLQDEWAVTDRLQLMAGLRADVPLLPEAPGANPELTEAFAALPASRDIRTDRMPTGNVLLSPRAGFNWRPDEATQVRGGAGLFAGRPPFVWLFNAFQNTGLESVSLTCLGENAPPLDPAAPAPTACLDGTEPSVAGQAVVNTFDPDFRFPQDLKLSLGVDRRLPGDLVASVEWLYSRAVNQIFLEDINLAPALVSPLEEEGYSDGFGFRGGGRVAFGTPTLEGFDPRRLADGFGPVIRVTNADRNFAYAASVQLERSVGRRFGVRAGYSLTRSADTQSLFTDDVTSNFGLTAIEGSPNDPQRQRALFDRPHKAVLHAWGRFLDRWGGTELSLFYVGQSGRPYSYVYAADVNGDGYPGGGRTLDLTNDLLFVPLGAFDVPGGGISGALLESLVRQEPCLEENRNRVLARNLCRLPWSNRLDLRLLQNVRAGPARVQVTFDMLNLLNFLNSQWGRVETAAPLVEVLRLDGRRSDEPRMFVLPSDPLVVQYVGPVQRSGPGGIQAALPTVFEVTSSQWQAQLGARVSF